MATMDGADEMFGPDLDEATLKSRLGHINVPLPRYFSPFLDPH